MIALAIVIQLAGCGGSSLYKVKRVVEASIPETGEVARKDDGDVAVSARLLLADEESQELFEANLPLSGLLPVHVELINRGGAPIELKRVRFRLRDGANREWKSRTPKQTITRILDANGVTLYNPRARAKFEEDFVEHALDTASPLPPAVRRRGLIFFQTPKKEAIESPRGLVLIVEKLPQPVEVQLN